MVQWLITDIDGTITDHHGRLDAGAVRCLRELEEQGVPVGLVSGRPYPMVAMLGEYLGLSGPLIAENGGALRFRDERRQLGARGIPLDAIARLAQVLPIRPAWDNEWRVSDCAIEPSVPLSDIRREIDRLGLDVEVQASSIMVHFAQKGVTKRSAIEWWLESVNVHGDDILVAGDSDSDLPMFEAFPHSMAPSTSTAAILALAAYRANGSHATGFCEGVSHFRELDVLPR